MPETSNPFELERFVEAQEPTYRQALAELRKGRKQTHWMWYVFPQIAGLGSSPMAQRYAIESRAEAEAYLAHPLLGQRLIECTEAVLVHRGVSAHAIFGSPDDMKFRSAMTLFGAVSKKGSPFERALRQFYDGVPDERTLALVG